MIKLITGGSGLIGSEFKDGIKINSSQYNLLKEDDVIRMYQEIKPDVVVHTAAKVGGVKANMDALADFFYDNIKMNTSTIHYAKEFNVKKFVCFTSTCVFPDKVDLPLTEDKIHLGPPHETNYAYAHAKRMADVQIQAYNQQYGTKYFSVIPANVYGFNDNYNLEKGHVVPALIHKVYLSMLKNEDVEVWGSGKPMREFIYSRDVADITNILIDKYEDTKPIIISATNQEVSIEELITTICDIFKFKKNIFFDKTKPEGQFRKPSSNEYLKSIIGDYKFTPLRNGLEETIDYFIKNYEKLRK
jgi:GDP-L-fucose synthase